MITRKCTQTCHLLSTGGKCVMIITLTVEQNCVNKMQYTFSLKSLEVCKPQNVSVSMKISKV